MLYIRSLSGWPMYSYVSDVALVVVNYGFELKWLVQNYKFVMKLIHGSSTFSPNAPRNNHIYVKFYFGFVKLVWQWLVLNDSLFLKSVA